MRAAVIGSPIGHSRSPALHRAAYLALGLTSWTYEAVECTEAGFADHVAGLGPDWAGLSVTMPLKRAALAVAAPASVSARAAGVGAANTLLRRPDGGWAADNTDVAGLVAALREAGLESAAGAVVLGAGGTAAAALAALAELGEPEPLVLVREPARAGDLLAAAERLGIRPRLRRGVDDPVLAGAPLVISTLPAGAGDPLAGAFAPGPGFVLDVVYHPWPTPLATGARAAGRTVVGGAAMLLHQAVGQVEAMTGCRPAPIEAMRVALGSRPAW